MIRKTALFICILLAHQAWSQVKFPELSGELLNGKKITLPKDNNGKISFIGIAMSPKAEKSLKTWFQPVYDLFLEKESPNSIIPVDNYDVNVFFVPVISGVAQAAGGKIEKEMKNGIDPEFHPYVLLYKGNADVVKKTLSMDDKDTPYFFLVDKDGKVLHATQGEFSDEKLEEIERYIE